MKAVRILGKVLLGLVALIVAVIGVSYIVSSAKARKIHDVPARSVVVPTDSASIARGEVLATLNGCNGCHMGNLGGRLMIDAFPFAKVPAPNLTSGAGGVVAGYTEADWERAIRHGVRHDGTPIFIMPSSLFNPMRDEELGRLIAYMKSVPPVNNDTLPGRSLYPIARVLLTFGAPLFEASKIDHAQQVRGPVPAATLEYGAYLAGSCRFCHGDDLAGKKVGGEPGAPPSPSIGSTANPAKWTDEQFISTMRTGTTPAGWALRNQYMPWKAIGQLRDEELRALLMYLKNGP